MNAITKVQMTVPQFLDWAAARRARLPYDEAKWELFDGIPEMQDHERWSHAKAKIAIYLAIRAAVTKSELPLEVAIDSVGVEIAANATYRPEVVVFPAGEIGDDDRLAPRPIIAVEVMSPSSATRIFGSRPRDMAECRRSSTTWSLIQTPAPSTIIGGTDCNSSLRKTVSRQVAFLSIRRASRSQSPIASAAEGSLAFDLLTPLVAPS